MRGFGKGLICGADSSHLKINFFENPFYYAQFFSRYEKFVYGLIVLRMVYRSMISGKSVLHQIRLRKMCKHLPKNE